MSEQVDSERTLQADDALRIMKSWDWMRYDPDGVPSANAVPLATAVSKLAYYGHLDPAGALLALFCDGSIQAFGCSTWAKYHALQEYRLESENCLIESMRWKKLRANLAMHEGDYAKGEYVEAFVSLENLEIVGEPVAEWEPKFNRFSYATCTTALDPWDGEYFEEFFSAHSLGVFPLAMPGPDGEIVGISDEVDGAHAEAVGDGVRRGRKPKYDWPAASAAIWGKIYRGELIPENQAAIERAFQAYLTIGDKEPSESTVRPFARTIWDQISKA